jgi:gluconokinase
MKAGHPLNDDDRRPWLEAIAAEIDRVGTAHEKIIIACSALKRAYRDILIHGRDDVLVIYLDGSRDLIAERLANRKGHFMPADLLDSQFKDLQVPDDDEPAIAVPIDATVDAIVDDIVETLGFGKDHR